MVEDGAGAKSCDVSDCAVGEELIGLEILPELLRDVGRISGDEE